MRATEPTKPDYDEPGCEKTEVSLSATRFRIVQGRTGPDIRSFVSRLAVILAADVVDYTRHMAEDEHRTHARFTIIVRNVIEPGIDRHQGRIVKNTGDGFLAEFSSATQALWFALGAQHEIRFSNARLPKRRRLEFRVGINLGDVIVEPHDVFGHVVNVAARLEGLAEPGGVLVSHAVFASVRDPRFAFEDIGELSLRNMNEIVRGFRVKFSGRVTSSRWPHVFAR